MIGMSYKILPTKEFSKDFKKLDNSLKILVKSKINDVSHNPTRFKHLHYNLSRSCRIRVKKLRILFSYNEELKELYLEKIVFDHRYTS
jgi:mRNA-degrading endonuclease RelE of RelBE toxin-antitoxin system